MMGPAQVTEDPRSERAERAGAWFGVAVALLLGALLRGLPLISAGFPLNDGGLFARMIQDLVENGFRIPAETTYNALEIPFAYPPLGFYLAGSAHAVFGVAVTDTLMILPFTCALLTIPAVYWLASGVLASRAAAVLAALSFALVPRAYLWVVSGGGITRAPGLLLAILALVLAWRLASNQGGRRRTMLLLGVLGGLTVLTHLQAALFVAVSALVFTIIAADRRRYVVRLVVAGFIGVLVVLPWVVVVVGVHGWAPLISAAASGSSPLLGLGNLFTFRFTELFFFDVITYMGVIGLVIALRHRSWLLPAWLVTTLLVDGRAGSTFSMIPLSLLVGFGVVSLAPSAVGLLSTRPVPWIRGHPGSSLTMLSLVFILFLASSISAQRPQSPMHALSVDQRAAMEWSAANLPEDASLAVVTNSIWERDATSEWIPVLALRRSVGTVQGTEWLGGAAFASSQVAYSDLQACADDVLPCVLTWADDNGIVVSHVYLPKGQLHGPFSDDDCCPGLRHSVPLVEGATVVYDGPGATIIALP